MVRRGLFDDEDKVRDRGSSIICIFVLGEEETTTDSCVRAKEGLLMSVRRFASVNAIWACIEKYPTTKAPPI